MPVARRGEIWQVDLGMVAKVRPAMILNVPFHDNERAVFQIVPHTTAVRSTRFEAAIAVPGLEGWIHAPRAAKGEPLRVVLGGPTGAP